MVDVLKVLIKIPNSYMTTNTMIIHNMIKIGYIIGTNLCQLMLATLALNIQYYHKHVDFVEYLSTGNVYHWVKNGTNTWVDIKNTLGSKNEFLGSLGAF